MPIKEQLDRAEQFLESNPNRAMDVAQAILTLHSHHSWALPQINRAKDLLVQAKLKINVQQAN